MPKKKHMKKHKVKRTIRHKIRHKKAKHVSHRIHQKHHAKHRIHHKKHHIKHKKIRHASMHAGLPRYQKATFAGGCFWGVEEEFRQVNGVTSTRVGYVGGTKKNPTYEEVCSHKTGHAEAVEVTFDPNLVTYDDLLEVFWKAHDPTQFNRQGPDVGTQYRSVIFYHSVAQKKAAEESMREEQKKRTNKIMTQIVRASKFYKAEDYHQQYLAKKGLKVCHF